MLEITGIGVINATPLAPDNRLNEAEYRRHIRWLAQKGIRFVHPVAATGQAMQTTEEEYKRILEITVEELRGKVLVMAYSGRPGTEDTIRLTQIARDIGCDCAYLIQPFYTRPDAEGIYRHYRAVARAVPGFPLVLYNNPDRAGVETPQDVVVRLVSEFDNFVGLKQGNLNAFLDNSGALRGKIPVWPKSEKEMLVGLAHGAPGALTFAGNIIPGELVAIVDAWNRGELQRAREIYFRFLPLMNLIHIEPVPGPIKYMLNRTGFAFGNCRLPIHEVSEDNARKIDRVLEELQLV
jgi:4-hydroxy-tetrahydrodipicolinate synthase